MPQITILYKFPNISNKPRPGVKIKPLIFLNLHTKVDHGLLSSYRCQHSALSNVKQRRQLLYPLISAWIIAFQAMLSHLLLLSCTTVKHQTPFLKPTSRNGY